MPPETTQYPVPPPVPVIGTPQASLAPVYAPAAPSAPQPQPAVPPQPQVAPIAVGGPAVPPANPAAPGQQVDHQNINRDERLARFKDLLVALNRESEDLFDMPVDVFIIMVQRYANRSEAQGSGHMAVFGEISQFVPDLPTFREWVGTYVDELRRRELAAGGGAEM